jgi:hypothetical protein
LMRQAFSLFTDLARIAGKHRAIVFAHLRGVARSHAQLATATASQVLRGGAYLSFTSLTFD